MSRPSASTCSDLELRTIDNERFFALWREETGPQPT